MSDLAKQTMTTEDALVRGRELVAKIKALLKKRQPPPHVDVLKWDRNQPRGEKGTHLGGKWVKGVSQGSGEIVQIGKPGKAQFPGDSERIRRNMSTIPPGMERHQGMASLAAIMNAPTGTGFANTPRGVNLPVPPAPPPTPVPEPSKTLVEGTVQSTEPLGSGANASVVVEFEDGTKAIYKPETGENWGDNGGGFANSDISDYITNKNFSLAEREATAYEVGQQLFGADNPVPETVLRTSLPGVDESMLGGGGGEGGGGYDPAELVQMYESYRDKAMEKAMDHVGEEFAQLYEDAQKEHAKEIEDRTQEMLDIWNEERQKYPQVGPYGAGSQLRQHPILPLGSKPPFQRGAALEAELDPLEILDAAGVDVSASLSSHEKDRVREILTAKLEEGYRKLGGVGQQAARDHLDRDQWMEDHADTENRLYESKIQNFDTWKQNKGYHDYNSEGGGGGGSTNDEAPHPNGGSLQRWKDSDWSGTASHEDKVRMAVLDYVIGTMDRHGSNLLWANNRPVAIDNGYSMPDVDPPDGIQFRSVAVENWMNSSSSQTSVPASISEPILKGLNRDWKALLDRHPGMNQGERDAFLGRVENMKDALSTDDGLLTLWEAQRLM